MLAELLFLLSGKLEPPAPALVTLYSATTPYNDQAAADARGRFEFKKLPPGIYNVVIHQAGGVEHRRSVSVGPSFADESGRIDVTLRADPADGFSSRAHTVSRSQLAIPERARKEYESAQKLLARRDAAGAVQRLERAVELAPKFAAAWNHLGTIAYQSQRYPDAESHFRKALEADPEEYAPLVNLGGVLLNLQRPKEALDYNRDAARRQPTDPLAHAQLGLNYFQLGRIDLAIHHLTAAKKLDPVHFTTPQLTLAEIHIRRNDAEAAAREFEEYLQVHPDAPDAKKIRGLLRLLRGQEQHRKEIEIP